MKSYRTVMIGFAGMISLLGGLGIVGALHIPEVYSSFGSCVSAVVAAIALKAGAEKFAQKPPEGVDQK